MSIVHRRGLLAGALAGLAFSPRGWAQGKPLTCGIIDVPPWITHDPQRPGLGADIVARLSASTGLSIQPEPAPHSRLLMQLRAGQIDLVAFIPQRELEEAGLVLGTLGELAMGLITRAGLVMTRVEDIANGTVGLVRGSGIGPLVNRLPPSTVRLDVRDVVQGLDMIAGGRIDGFVGSRLGFEWHIRQTSMDPNQFGAFFPLGWHSITLYLSRAHNYAPEMVERLRAGTAPVAAAFDELSLPYRR